VSDPGPFGASCVKFVTALGGDIDFRGTYLFTYNLLEFIGFLYITTSLSYNLIKHGSGKAQNTCYAKFYLGK